MVDYFHIKYLYSSIYIYISIYIYNISIYILYTMGIMQKNNKCIILNRYQFYTYIIDNLYANSIKANVKIRMIFINNTFLNQVLYNDILYSMNCLLRLF